MMIFRFQGKKYRGESALEVVRALESDAADYPHRGQSVRRFLVWSLERLCSQLPPRDLDLSDRLEDETLALSYLYLRDEYGAGTLSVGGAQERGGSRRNRFTYNADGAPREGR